MEKIKDIYEKFEEVGNLDLAEEIRSAYEDVLEDHETFHLLHLDSMYLQGTLGCLAAARLISDEDYSVAMEEIFKYLIDKKLTEELEATDNG